MAKGIIHSVTATAKNEKKHNSDDFTIVSIGNSEFRVKTLKSEPDKKIMATDEIYVSLLNYWEPEKITSIPEYRAIGLNAENNPFIEVTFKDEELGQTELAGFFKVLKEKNAAKVVIGKNHPFNNVIPTQEEEKVADKFFKKGIKQNILVLDQLIMSRMEYFSFKENEK